MFRRTWTKPTLVRLTTRKGFVKAIKGTLDSIPGTFANEDITITTSPTFEALRRRRKSTELRPTAALFCGRALTARIAEPVESWPETAFAETRQVSSREALGAVPAECFLNLYDGAVKCGSTCARRKIYPGEGPTDPRPRRCFWLRRSYRTTGRHFR
jgi:hypothetical protein